MQILSTIPLSLYTLLVCSLLPIIYFGYHAKLWYQPTVMRRYDLLLGALALGLALVVVAQLVLAIGGDGSSNLRSIIELVILHLIPIATTIMLIRRPSGVSSGPAQAQAHGTSSDGFDPQPVNDAVEKLTWNDLVIARDLEEELKSVITLLQDSKAASRYGIAVPKGILLDGPPGTGKTTIAKVMANEAKMSFFVLKLDEVVSKWVGDSERNLTRLFQAAQKHSPSIIFIDEIDSIGKSRSGSVQWADNLLNHLLQLVDGVVKSEGLYIIAATNRADLVDEALKRSGRLSRTITVPLPELAARKQLFAVHISKLKLADDVDIDRLAELTVGRSGADIKELCNQAGLNAFRRESSSKQRNYQVTSADVQTALEKIMRG